MNGTSDLERRVAGWLADTASSAGSDRVLSAALAQVEMTGQERFVTQRLLGDELGRSRQLRLVLLAAMLAIAALGVALAVGALRREPPRPQGPAANGWVAVSAKSTSGDDITGENVGRGDPNDIYLVREGMPARRVLGAEGDQLHKFCPAFSPDGKRLAYVELDMRSITATPPPAPPGAEGPTQDPEAPAPAALQWNIVFAEPADDGSSASMAGKGAAQPTLSSCAEWSPEGQRLAYAAATPAGGQALWTVGPDGRSMRLGPEVNPRNVVNYLATAKAFEWSPDGSVIALLSDDRVWLVPSDGAAPSSVPVQGAGSVSWSPDGTMLALGLDSSVRIVTTAGETVAAMATGVSGDDPPLFPWSPDGRWIAWATATDLVRASPDGRRIERRPFDAGRVLGSEDESYRPMPSIEDWSADGESLLVSAGGPDVAGALLSIPWDRGRPDVVLVKPTFACCHGVSWQEVRK